MAAPVNNTTMPVSPTAEYYPKIKAITDKIYDLITTEGTFSAGEVEVSEPYPFKGSKHCFIMANNDNIYQQSFTEERHEVEVVIIPIVEGYTGTKNHEDLVIAVGSVVDALKADITLSGAVDYGLISAIKWDFRFDIKGKSDVIRWAEIHAKYRFTLTQD